MARYAGEANGEEKESWSESSNPGKRGLAKVGVGLKGVWEALPAF